MWRRAVWLVVLLAAPLIGLGFWATRGRSADALYQNASAAYFAGRYDEAADQIKRLETLRPPTRFDRLLRGMVASARNEPDKALAELAQISDDDPVAPVARITAGQTEIRRGRTRAAEAAFLEAIRLMPSAVQARHELVFIYNIQHRQIELDTQLTELSELETLSFDHVLHWTKTRNVVWSPKTDLPVLEKFVEADPDDRWSRLALAEGLRRLARREEAEDVLKYLPDSDPDARAIRAMLALDRGDIEAADVLANKNSEDSTALARIRGQLALMKHQPAKAIEAYRKALAADPVDRATLSGLGTALKMSGDLKAAEPYLSISQRHDALWELVSRGSTEEGARDPKLLYRMGVGCAAVGRTAEARAWLRLAIKKDPTDRQAQEELFKLERRDRAPAPLSVSDTAN